MGSTWGQHGLNMGQSADNPGSIWGPPAAPYHGRYPARHSTCDTSIFSAAATLPLRARTTGPGRYCPLDALLPLDGSTDCVRCVGHRTLVGWLDGDALDLGSSKALDYEHSPMLHTKHTEPKRQVMQI
jgi:hypothetical protein